MAPGNHLSGRPPTLPEQYQAPAPLPHPQKKRKRAPSTTASTPDTDEPETTLSIDGVPPSPASRATKKAKPHTPPTCATDLEIHILLAGIAALPADAWTHPTIPPAYCEIIKGFDHDGLDVHAIAAKYGEARELRGTGVDKGIYKHYARYGPVFYEAKGLSWATRGERKEYLKRMKGAGKGGVVRGGEAANGSSAPVLGDGSVDGAPEGYAAASGGRAGRGGRGTRASEPSSASGERGRPVNQQKGKANASTEKIYTTKSRTPSPDEKPLDRKLRQLFSKTFTKKKPQLLIRTRKEKEQQPADDGPSADDLARYHQNRNGKDLLHFKREVGDAILGDPSRPVLDRKAAARSAYPIDELLENCPTLRVIEYAGVAQNTVQRFVACISPTLRTSLPTHDIAEAAENGEAVVRATPIQWSMHELVELYRFAMDLGADYVCDMVLDRWFEELRRPTRRTLWNEDGEAEAFDIMDFGPEFLNHLWEKGDNADKEEWWDKNGNGDVAQEFFTDLLVMQKRDGWKVVDKYSALTREVRQHTKDKEKDREKYAKFRERYGQFSWETKVKEKLVEKLEKEEIDLLKGDEMEFCRRYHHHHRQGGGECYRIQALLDKARESGKNSAAAAPETDPPTFRKLDPVAIYWKHQEELFKEKEWRSHQLQLLRQQPNDASYDEEEDNARLVVIDFRDRACDRHTEQKALKAEEEAMDAINISIVPRPYMPEQNDDEEAHMDVPHTPLAPPAGDSGIKYADHLGKYKSKEIWQAHEKLQSVRSKLEAFQDAEYVDTEDEGEGGGGQEQEYDEEDENGVEEN